MHKKEGEGSEERERERERSSHISERVDVQSCQFIYLFIVKF